MDWRFFIDSGNWHWTGSPVFLGLGFRGSSVYWLGFFRDWIRTLNFRLSLDDQINKTKINFLFAIA